VSLPIVIIKRRKMLNLTPTNDKALLNSLSSSIFDCEYEGEVGFVLYKDEESIGLAKIFCSEEKSEILKLGIIPSKRKLGYGDFFTRSMILRMSMVSKCVEINYTSDYYKKFGFIEKKGKMVINSDKVVFPCACKKGE
jgi:hypothetical protein